MQIQEDSVTESFELITIAEFENRLRLARPWRIIMIIVVFSGISSIAAIMILLANAYFWSAFLVILLLVLLSICAISLGRYIAPRFKLRCPSCQKSIESNFESFKSYIRTKGKIYRNWNPFISGECMYCKKTVIKVDPELNRCLQERNAEIKANSSNPYVSFVCFLIGFIAFALLISDGDESDEKTENINIRSARIQIAEGQFQKARNTLLELLIKQPNYSIANEWLGYVYLQDGEFDKALRRYQKALPYSEGPDEIQRTIALIEQRLENQ